MAKSDAFILSSYQFDSQSMVLLESIAVAVPAIISDPDLAESIPSGGGVITDTPDVIGLRDAIADMVANPDRLIAMREILLAYRGSVAQSRMTEKMLGIYEKLI
jgi:glycosyltransferase involved in cell wall biosynthesis